ncbi:MAG: amidohydrolase family protein [Pseudomonadales bacterium]|nr:amidohydrolase family protein [Pseudomonadales bacterium]MBO6595872.1 amidohydrolase family protein [Pseudomonadales bacterium]MBO6702477.1 amidohydrolase family protein [Pseudomonadales bacterium]MBO6822356.1 amidohydrolase family protein [Pseudomonadales bacterium]MBO7005871.1 amidohydrolase family protein [Pseudomonadales bacterium]
MLDLIIRNGTIVDGTGMPGYMGDIGIQDGKIVATGSIDDSATEEVDATGLTVAPGFIDPHTHFDAQLLWDGKAKPAIEHGVTTIVPGNCSLSLAPLKAEHRMKLVGMFNQIEEMPIKAFEEGVEWNWETFDEFIARIKKGLTINVAPLVGHSVLRLWVMGDASMERTANAEEIKGMQALLEECLKAGAIGLSTSFVDMDETLQPVPSRYADQEELHALCEVLSSHNKILQIVHEFYDADLTVARIDQLAEISLKYKITTTFSPLFVNATEDDSVAKVMARVDEQFQRGARVWPQVQTRPIDISFCFEVPSLLFIRLPSWYQVMRFGTHDEIVAAFKDEERRTQMVAEAETMSPLWDMLVLRQVDSDANQSLVGKTLAEIAGMRNTSAIETMIDLSLEEDLQAHFLAANMGHTDNAMVGELLANPRVHLGASDGGAHILSFSTYGDTGYLFSQFVRHCKALTIEQAVKKITLDTANIWGMKNRGVLKEGYAADVTIFDAEQIDRGDEYYTDDVPGDGHRYVRDAIGVHTVVIGGAVAYQDGEYTDSARGSIV